VLVVALALLLSLLVPSAPSLAADAPASTIVGSVIAQDGGLPISGATVTLQHGNADVATTKTDGAGRYSFTDEPPAVYSVEIRAEGYQITRVDEIATAPGSTATVNTPLLRSELNSRGQLREIGNARASANGNTLASSSTIQYNLDPEQLQAQGLLKSADELQNVPGINLNGSPHTVGDDTFIDIRGMGPGEVGVLLDGHRVGPIGVDAIDYYNFANSPFFLLQNVQATLGSGASGLYGTDVIGGTIDLQTLVPTLKPHAELIEGAGNLGTGETFFKATGTFDKLGYAVGHTVTGTYGDFAPGPRFQGARPNNNGNANNGGACLPSGNQVADISSCNTALNTYSVSGNYRVQSDLAKLRYAISPVTALTVTAYAGNQLSDSTGNGDNDFLPYDTRLAQIESSTPNCGAGYIVATNTSPNSCYSAKALAASTFGPDGGGQDRNRGTSLQDYHARFETQLANNQFTADIYQDYYDFRKNSNTAGGLDPTGTYFVGGGTFQDNYLTSGALLSDDIAGLKNDFGFGYAVEHQRIYGNEFTPGPPPSYLPDQEFGEGDWSFFARDQFNPTRNFSFFANAWLRRSDVTNKTTLDPRASFVFRPSPNDIVRLTGGRADGDPAANIKATGAITGVSNPSSLNPSCNIPNAVASAGNPSLLPEQSTDLELAYGHRFFADTSINVSGYVSSIKEQLQNGVEPILQYGALGYESPALTPFLAGFATKINAACGTHYDATTVLQALGVSTPFNISSALFRGIELKGRVRIAPTVYADVVYDIQSSQQFGIPASVLVNNPFLLNGGQIYEIPLHKGSLTLDYNDHHGIEAQLAGNYVGVNNTLNRPGYTMFNGFVSKDLTRTTTVTVGASNLFNENVQLYGYFGHQLEAATNQYQAQASTPIQQAVVYGFGTQEEQLGLTPRIIILSVSQRI
jgi:outer membrane cobalamin receptor